jgi:hypothetical protein
MQTALADLASTAPQVPLANRASHERIPAAFRTLEDRQYLVMQHAFRTTGGVVCGDQLAHALRKRVEQPVSVVARWIVGREVVSYAWRSQTMLPLFQFDMPRVVLRSSAAGVIRELKDVYTDWGLAMWFVESNSWLDGATPLATIETDPSAVLDAARADRFVANG